MPALLFPSDDVLRLALAAGVIPHDVAVAPVAAGVDDAGRLWADVPADIARDGLAALQRFGARVLGPGGPPPHTFHCWHQLLPLRPEPATDGPHPVLIEIPDDDLPRTFARLRRLAPQPADVRFLPTAGGPGRAWIRAGSCPRFLGSDERVVVFVRAAPDVWVRAGWAHPLAEAIRPPAGVAYLLDPHREWRAVPDAPFFRAAPAYRIGRAPPAGPTAGPPPAPVPVPLYLRPRRDPRPDEVGIFAADAGFEAFLRGADGRVLRGWRAAVVAAGDRRRVLVRPARAGFVPALPATGYAAHPGLPGLLVPATHVLTPAVRRDRLASVFGVGDGRLVWIEPDPSGGFTTHRATAAHFRPAADLVDYQALPVSRLDASWGGDRSFEFDPVGPVIDPEPVREPEGTDRTRGPGRAGDGWLTRSLDKLSKKLRRGRPPPAARVEPHPPPAARADSEKPEPAAGPPPHEWAARRAELQDRLIHQLPRLPGGERGHLWAEAAELATATGQFADAGLCWANAVWETDRPPPVWFDGWLRAEQRLAKVSHGADELGVWLTLTTRRVPPRLVAAYLAWCGARATPPSDLPVRLPRLVALLDDRADKLPVRAGWLARLAAAGLADGDPLGLARWRDAVFRRLADVGPTLDLDAPGFVRFHGRPGGDRFQAARDWLLRVREPAHRWLARQASPRRLQWFGLDPETEATAGYLDLMFAWGVSRLGERNTGRDWEEAAAGVLGRPPGAGDAGVHAILLTAFRQRIRDAQQGRPDRPGLPADVLPAYALLTDFQRYAVDQLRRASRVLEPVDRVNPFRGRDAAEVLGGDALGQRLRRLGDVPAGDELDREVRALLSPTGDDPPRVILAAAAAAPRLPTATALDVLGRIPAAVRLAPETVWAARDQHATRPALEECLASLLDAAAHAAVVFDAPDVLRAVAHDLTGPTAPPVPVVQAAVGPIAGRFFRALRRLGLTAEAEAILTRVAPAGEGVVDRVGFAVGYLAVGNEDAAVALLDAARARLFAVGFGPPRVRSRLAVAYAAALGHAPPRLALGRLEEIFQRLDGAWTHGAANRFFTVSLLELIDTVVRSVVSDDFALGPAVRGWLDDAEFGTRRRISRDLDAVLQAHP